ncbi:hypothetical protein CKO31_03670 [Thiohalocapsa halophila]|uniref:DUF4365 domain-containing protein n=1 Tax=Thiohalocapsa halophila TaxID=69359 RepID=A0ABS1CD99_9GAMM|nr:hypothetical protein [Thiohalocapsa halophila]MBK1629854.1 hypothetical protein [Thiohalocapsa halophila]
MYPEISGTRKTGSEAFKSEGRQLPFDLLSFWQWSSSDLVGNALRGLLAEYIVAIAVGCSDRTRVEWNPYDLETPEGVRIEVKSGAYIQSWAQASLSRITFDIRPTQGWDASRNTYSHQVKRQSDVYAFCLLEHRHQETVDPLNLDQWTFYVISTAKLNRFVGAQKTISLTALLKLAPTEARFSGIRPAVAEAAVDE